jgi:hypothetical protein
MTVRTVLSSGKIFAAGLVICFLAAGTGLAAGKADAVRGEIININHEYQVAFIDIGQDRVKEGDIMVVDAGNDVNIFLEVDDATAVLARLVPSKQPGFMIREDDFRKIMIGNPVTLAVGNAPGGPPDGQRAPAIFVPEDVLLRQAEVERLKKEAELKDREISDLRRDNQVLRQQVSKTMLDDYAARQETEKYKAQRDQLRATVEALESRLKAMRDMLENNL